MDHKPYKFSMKYNYKHMCCAKLWTYIQKFNVDKKMLSPENNDGDNL